MKVAVLPSGVPAGVIVGFVAEWAWLPMIDQVTVSAPDALSRLRVTSELAATASSGGTALPLMVKSALATIGIQVSLNPPPLIRSDLAKCSFAGLMGLSVASWRTKATWRARSADGATTTFVVSLAVWTPLVR